MTDPIVAALKAERKRQRLTLQRLGEVLGRRTYQTVWQWENGASDLRLSNLRAWADALGFDLTLTKREDGPAVPGE